MTNSIFVDLIAMLLYDFFYYFRLTQHALIPRQLEQQPQSLNLGASQERPALVQELASTSHPYLFNLGIAKAQATIGQRQPKSLCRNNQQVKSTWML